MHERILDVYYGEKWERTIKIQVTTDWFGFWQGDGEIQRLKVKWSWLAISSDNLSVGSVHVTESSRNWLVHWLPYCALFACIFLCRFLAFLLLESPRSEACSEATGTRN